jgi:hypothetical protein
VLNFAMKGSMPKERIEMTQLWRKFYCPESGRDVWIEMLENESSWSLLKNNRPASHSCLVFPIWKPLCKVDQFQRYLEIMAVLCTAH